MEAFGVVLDEEWESLSKMFSSDDSDLLLGFNSENLFPNLVDDQSLSFPSDAFDQTNFFCVSQESSNSSDVEGALFSNPIDENGVSFLHNVTTNMSESTDFCTGLMAPIFLNDHMMEEIVPLKANAEYDDFLKEMTSKRKYDTAEMQTQDNDYSSDQSPKKKPQVSKDNGRKNKRNTRENYNFSPVTLFDAELTCRECANSHLHVSKGMLPARQVSFWLQNGHRRREKDQKCKIGTKRNKKAVQNEEEDNVNGVGNGQSSSTCSFDEDDSNCNVSQELNGGSTSESKGKAKASRGSATDPQCLYARRKRERINERLRILQNLVPNGTKVDISTMLEEAVHYVKFLQLQIKLQSSDELWMYAPIAYNRIDMGLYQKIIPNLSSQS